LGALVWSFMMLLRLNCLVQRTGGKGITDLVLEQ
jgi:hypothetical protein